MLYARHVNGLVCLGLPFAFQRVAEVAGNSEIAIAERRARADVFMDARLIADFALARLSRNFLSPLNDSKRGYQPELLVPPYQPTSSSTSSTSHSPREHFFCFLHLLISPQPCPQP